MPNMRCMRSLNDSISLWASKTESSGVFMIPEVMKCRRKSSSSPSLTFGLMTQQTKRSMYCTKGMSSRVLETLKAEWKAASAIEAFRANCVSVWGIDSSKPTMPKTRLLNGVSRMTTQSTPRQLMLRWAKAARRACVLAVSATMFEVMVVPMFSPSTSMMPWLMSSTPVEHSVMVMAMMAADDCTQSVRIVPISRNSSDVQMLGSLKLAKKACTASAYSPVTASEPVAFSVPRPKKRNATPKRKSPMMRCFFM